ncbi:hypothetical protein F652_576 [Enterobacteriaceae bacterium bta3-1]|nr:hypothetical protein F652_576 [Enterobacteriaceae bacterium bta3-1]
MQLKHFRAEKARYHSWQAKWSNTFYFTVLMLTGFYPSAAYIF